MSGGVPFCEECGALLNLPDSNPIECERCGFTTSYEGIQKTKITTNIDVYALITGVPSGCRVSRMEGG